MMKKCSCVLPVEVSKNASSALIVASRLAQHYLSTVRDAEMLHGIVRAPSGMRGVSGYGNRFAALPMCWLLAVASRRCMHLEDKGFDTFFNGRMWQCPPKILAKTLPTRKLFARPRRRVGHEIGWLVGALQGRTEIRGCDMSEAPSVQALAALPRAGVTRLRDLLLRAGASAADAANARFIDEVSHLALFSTLTPEAQAAKNSFTQAIGRACDVGHATSRSAAVLWSHRLDAAVHFRSGADLDSCGATANVNTMAKHSDYHECGRSHGLNDTLECVVPRLLHELGATEAGESRCVFVMSDKPSVANAVRTQLLRQRATTSSAVSVVTEGMVPGLHRIQLKFLNLHLKNVTKWVPQWRANHSDDRPLSMREWQLTQWHTGPLHRIALADASAALAHPAILGWLVFSEARFQMSIGDSTFSRTASIRGRGLVNAATVVVSRTCGKQRRAPSRTGLSEAIN